VNPDVIVLGGGVAQSGALLLDNLRSFLEEWASPTITYSTEILPRPWGITRPFTGPQHWDWKSLELQPFYNLVNTQVAGQKTFKPL